jgi:hypothetical protein
VTSVADYEGTSDADIEFWRRYASQVSPDLKARLEELRPPRPFWICESDPDEMERWALCWRCAAALALFAAPDDPARELRNFVWFASRTIYESDIPTDLH